MADDAFPPRRPARTPPSDAVVFDAMAQHISTVLDAYAQMALSSGWQPTDDAFATFERRKLSRKRGPAEDWTDESSRRAVAYATSLLGIASQHLEGLIVLLQSRHVLFSPAVLVRSIFEISAYVAWLLDHRIGIRERAARVYLATIDDLTNEKNVHYKLGSARATALGDEVRALKHEKLHARFFNEEIEYDKRTGALILRGQRLPGLSARLSFLEGVHNAADWKTDGMYTWLSNATHPTPSVAREFMSRDESGGWQFAIPDGTYPYRIARAGSMAFIKAWTLLASYLGLGQEIPDRLGEAIDGLPEPGKP